MADLSTDALPDLPGTTAGRRRRRRNRIAASVAALCLVAGAVWGVRILTRAPAPCGGSGSGLSLVDGECVGVTDASDGYAFSPDLASVERDISGENAWALGTGRPVATVAVLEPFTVNATSPLTPSQIRNDLEGAYTAQYRVNHTPVVGDQVPLIRLVLANEGSHEDQWAQVVRQLEGMTGGPHPLVAVTGLGYSTQQTLTGAQALGADHIPTVAAIDTADQLNHTSIPGFVRVAASNQQYVDSLQAYLARIPGRHSAILVYDSNADSSSDADLFTGSLRADLQKSFGKELQFAPQGFNGVSGSTQAEPDLFSNITTNICSVSPGIVLFAGREIDLDGFLQSLEARVCSRTPIVVATAGSNLGGVHNQTTALEQAHITVVYSTLSDPSDWVANGPGTPQHFAEFEAAFQQRGFPTSDLTDGGAISTHDSILVAARAIRMATQGARIPTAVDVFDQMLNLNNEFVVPAASGDLGFSYHGANGSLSSDPIGKPVPIIVIPSTPSDPDPLQDTYITSE